MSTINISFNGKNYSIDESNLSTAIAGLQEYLSTDMSGTGEIINLGGSSYNIDSVKLSNATSDFVAYLNTIAGEGLEVAVNDIVYSVDSTKTSDALVELETILDGSNSGDAVGEPVESTLSLRNKNQRTSYGTELAIWEQNGITLTHEKSNGMMDIPDYANPMRVMTNQEFTISCGRPIKKITYVCASVTYAQGAMLTSINNNLGVSEGATVTRENQNVCIEFDTPVDSFTVKATGQIRISEIVVVHY